MAHRPARHADRRFQAERGRRTAGAGLLLVLLLVAAGCGGDEEQEPSEQAAADTATTAEAVESSAEDVPDDAADAVTIDGETFDAVIVERTARAAKIQRASATPGAAAPGRLGARKGSCFWSRNTIWATATFENRLEEPVTVLVQPIHRLRNAGIHGRDDGSQVAVELQPGEVREWAHDLGKPDGIAETKQPPITRCTLRIDDVLPG